MEQPLDVFSLKFWEGARMGPGIPTRRCFIPKNPGSPSLPEGLPKLGCFPAHVSKESELWDKVTMATEAGIQEGRECQIQEGSAAAADLRDPGAFSQEKGTPGCSSSFWLRLELENGSLRESRECEGSWVPPERTSRSYRQHQIQGILFHGMANRGEPFPATFQGQRPPTNPFFFGNVEGAPPLQRELPALPAAGRGSCLLLHPSGKRLGFLGAGWISHGIPPPGAPKCSQPPFSTELGRSSSVHPQNSLKSVEGGVENVSSDSSWAGIWESSIRKLLGKGRRSWDPGILLRKNG